MLDGTAGAPPPTCQTRVCGGGQWVCFRDALSADEVTRATRFLSERAASSREAFTLIERAAADDDAAAAATSAWLHARCLELAAAAARAAGWAACASGGQGLRAVDPLVYDRFGPAFSAPEFRWHRDAQPGDGRAVSLVLYFTPPEAYAGGELRIRARRDPAADAGDAAAVAPSAPPPPRDAATATPAPPHAAAADADERAVWSYRFGVGDAVAFPSAELEHCVAPVVEGERHSLLLLAGGDEVWRSAGPGLQIAASTCLTQP